MAHASRRAVALAVLVLLTVGACSGRDGGADRPRRTDTTRPAIASAPPPPASAGADWLTYHHDVGRSGVAGDQDPLGTVRQAWDSPPLDGKVYAQPLIVDDRVLVATEGNSVYALDRGSGAVAWRAALGEPVAGDSLPCGNIDPSGITATPVVDAARRTIDVLAFLQPGPHHELFGLDLATGAVRWHRPLDPPGLRPEVEQARGALTLAGDRIYVPFGGLFGDCGPYKGAIVSVAGDGQGEPTAYVVPTTREGGIWTPGGPVIDADGNLWVATGNTESSSTFDYGNAVIRLSPGLVAQDYYAPTNWAALNRSDTDLGSAGPVLLPGTDRVFAIGKEGIGFLLDRANLGHEGGHVFSSQLCDAAFGTAASKDGTMYVPCVDSLVAVRARRDRFDVAWRSDDGAASPIIAAGAVWALGGDGTLSAYDPAQGAVRFTTRIGPVTRFGSPAAARGLLAVATGNKVVAFLLR